MTKTTNLYFQPSMIDRAQRTTRNQHAGCLVWITGLPSSGKSTLANRLEEALFAAGCSTLVLDGDNIRQGLCSDLGFSPEDRQENIRRIGEVAKLFVNAGFITLAAFVSPYLLDRERVRQTVGISNYFEIYCQCPLEICELRDPKGHYMKARNGSISNFTGISAPYEAPENPDLKIATDQQSPDGAAKQFIHLLYERKIISASQFQLLIK